MSNELPGDAAVAGARVPPKSKGLADIKTKYLYCLYQRNRVSLTWYKPRLQIQCGRDSEGGPLPPSFSSLRVPAPPQPMRKEANESVLCCYTLELIPQFLTAFLTLEKKF